MPAFNGALISDRAIGVSDPHPPICPRHRESFTLVPKTADNEAGECRGHCEGGRGRLDYLTDFRRLAFSPRTRFPCGARAGTPDRVPYEMRHNVAITR